MFRKKSPTKCIVLSFFGGKSVGKVLKKILFLQLINVILLIII
ncbi:hypothetical protein BOVA604_1141 [Bacteroides ovatus]|nr:hypothetical protein BOVA604_1141 [Bacteroides ovatus]